MLERNQDALNAIQNALNAFSDGNLTENALNLFQTLGYESERQQPFDNKNFDDFAEYITEESRFSEENAFVSEWKYVDLLFQLTETELSNQFSMFDTKEVEAEQFNSYLFFTVELNLRKSDGKEFTRTDLANITREINKCFPMPVFVLFKRENLLTLSVINRRLHKRDETKDVIEIKKVSLIKDIDFLDPKRSHLEILKDLSLEELTKKYKFQNFAELHKAWMATLDTKELNKRFFRELSNWYFWAVSKVKFPKAPTDTDSDETHCAKSVIRLITRLIFVWFLKEKGLIDDELFRMRELKQVLKFEDESAFYKAILQNLFFATLNTDGEDSKTPRKFRNESEGAWYKGNIGIPNVFRYKNEFLTPDETLKKYFLKVPFLNGGLFECLDKADEKIYVDGFSERKDNVLSVPDELFFCEECVLDLSEVYNDNKKSREKVRGLIRILDNYKFTIAENTPIEEEIALDPELLGKVFENLLANYNPETKTTARKQTGSFYTPREIVNYMVDESLIAYLKSKLQTETKGFGFVALKSPQPTFGGNDWKNGQLDLEYSLNQNRWFGKDEELENALRKLFNYDETENQFNELETEILIKAINDCKILDPACGSGAFPMGILQRLVYLLSKLDKGNVKWRELQKQEALKQIETVYDKFKDKDERQKRIDEIDEVFDLNSSDYGRKLFLIENCIYGVDIQPVAIQISKLRFFISLIIDQKIDDTRPNRGVRPLPNLETKLVAANTLLGLGEQRMLKPAKLNEKGVKIIDELEDKLQKARKEIFRARTPSTKMKWREKDKAIRSEIAQLLKEVGNPPDAANKIAEWSPDNQDVHAEWFDEEWMFGIEKGFDVVIGNPPYGINFNDEMKKYISKNFKSYKYKYESYIYFIEKSLNLNKKLGSVCFIVPELWLKLENAFPIRKLIAEKSSFEKLRIYGENVFSQAVVNTVVALFRVGGKINSLSVQNETDCWQIETLEWQKADNMAIDYNFRPETKAIIKNVKNSSLLLSDFGEAVQGITPYDKYRGQSPELIKKRGYHFSYKHDETCGKWLAGSDIGRYKINWSGEWLSYGEWLGAPREPRFFEGNRILFREIPGEGKRIQASFAEETFYHGHSITPFKPFSLSDIEINFLLGIVNSKLISWYGGLTLPNFGKDIFPKLNPQDIKSLPIPKATDAQQTEIAEVVDEIIEAKKQDQYANTSDLESKIDEMVYRLYGLTDEEIRIVEGKD